eukprot:scaffold118574_cov35-Tisochrysis_lutea.AAC.1
MKVMIPANGRELNAITKGRTGKVAKTRSAGVGSEASIRGEQALWARACCERSEANEGLMGVTGMSGSMWCICGCATCTHPLVVTAAGANAAVAARRPRCGGIFAENGLLAEAIGG